MESSEYMHPECSCADFTRSLIPCRGINAVLAQMKNGPQLWHEKNLPPRWRLRSHPLYHESVIACMGFDPTPTAPSTSTGPPTVPWSTLDIDVLGQISRRAPKETDKRYRNLHEVAKEICELGSRRSAFYYAKALASLGATLNVLKGLEEKTLDDEEFVDTISCAPIVQPPRHKNQSADKKRNLSRLNSKSSHISVRRKTQHHCKNCGEAGHHSNSNICPKK